jgi:hypothetical protein
MERPQISRGDLRAEILMGRSPVTEAAPGGPADDRNMISGLASPGCLSPSVPAPSAAPCFQNARISDSCAPRRSRGSGSLRRRSKRTAGLSSDALRADRRRFHFVLALTATHATLAAWLQCANCALPAVPILCRSWYRSAPTRTRRRMRRKPISSISAGSAAANGHRTWSRGTCSIERGVPAAKSCSGMRNAPRCSPTS